MEKNTQKHIDHKELAQRLQTEVDVILSKVNDHTLFAEFREDEVFTIQNGDKQEAVVHNTLDERIMYRRVPKETTIAMIDRHTANAAKKVTGLGRFVQYLFRPLHY
jgi:hypothetical protein